MTLHPCLKAGRKTFRPFSCLALVLLVIFCLHGVTPGFCLAEEAKEAVPNPAAEQAWQELKPDLELFWRDAEVSPFRTEQAAWPFIQRVRHFIQRFPNAPEAAEAYYILGEVYAQISYVPEALAHWRIVAKDFPQSPWASEALMAILHELDQTGDAQKIDAFSKELIRQYPDSTAARAAWILLATNVLRQGNVDLVTRETEKLEQAYPNLYLSLPRFLDLKAQLAAAKGQEDQARQLWIHYVNLTKSSSERAATLFRIAESYRRSNLFLDARKYYSIVVRDYAQEPEAYFARFRLTQLEAQEQARLSEYLGQTKQPGPSESTAELFSDIIKKFPGNPLTPEVVVDLMTLRMKQDRLVETLRLAKAFGPATAHTPSFAKASDLVDECLGRLTSGKANLADLHEAVDLGRALRQEGGTPNSLETKITQATPTLWVRFLEGLYDAKGYQKTLEGTWAFQKDYPGEAELGQRASQLGAASLLAMDRQGLSAGDAMGILDYDVRHRVKIEAMDVPTHFFYLGKAWQDLECPQAADRAFYKAWTMTPPEDILPDLLRSWASDTLTARDLPSTKAILDALDRASSGASDQPPTLILKARLAALRGDWVGAYALAQKAAEAFQDSPMPEDLTEVLFMAQVKLAEWPQTEALWKRMAPNLSTGKKAHFLRLWGDEALALEQTPEAIKAYQLLVALTPDDPAAGWRLAMARQQRLGAGQIADNWKALTQVPDPLWAGAARAIVANNAFWQGPAGAFRQLSAAQRPVSNTEGGTQ